MEQTLTEEQLTRVAMGFPLRPLHPQEALEALQYQQLPCAGQCKEHAEHACSAFGAVIAAFEDFDMEEDGSDKNLFEDALRLLSEHRHATPCQGPHLFRAIADNDVLMASLLDLADPDDPYGGNDECQDLLHDLQHYADHQIQDYSLKVLG